MAVPYSFGSATAAIPLSQLDSNFATTITLGNTAIQLGNTVTTLNNMSLANVTISSGSVTLTSASVANANVTSTLTLDGGTANGVAYLNTSKVVTTGSALVFDGTNFGLGTASPSFSGSSRRALTINAPTGQLSILELGVNGSLAGYLYSNASQTSLTSVGATPILFENNGQERARIDSAGNLGLGVTPFAWTSYKALQISNSAYFYGFGDNELGLGQGAYYSSGWKYAATSVPASWLNIYQGSYKFNIASGGGAGTSIGSWTQAMTLNASGQLVVGSTANPSGTTVKTAINGASGADSYYQFSNGSGGGGIIGSNNGAGINFYTFTGVVGSETYTQRAVIDSSGNFLVNQTGTALQNSNSCSFNIAGNSYLTVSHISGTATTTYYAAFGYNGSAIGSITQSGTTAVLYNITSDQRLKENIQDAVSASALIDALQVREYDWKSDGTHQRYGFIAQELVTVAPEAVYQPEDPEAMMAVDYSKLVPMLVKEIQSLRKRLAAAGI